MTDHLRLRPMGTLMMTDGNGNVVFEGTYDNLQIRHADEATGLRKRYDHTFDGVIHEGLITIDGRRIAIVRRDKNEKRINPAWQSGNPRSIRQTRAGGRR